MNAYSTISSAPLRERLLAAVDIPDSTVKRVSVGVFMTAVESVSIGCSYTLRDPQSIPHLCQEIRGAGTFHGKPVDEIAAMTASSLWLERSVGLAALNSVINRPDNPAVRGDILLWMKKNFSGKKVGMVGHFPFAPEIKSWAGEFHVVERNPVEDDLSGEEGARYLGSCDAIIITGVTLLNDSLSEILSASRKQAFKVLLGPTVPMHPFLFDVGVDALCSLVPTDSDAYYRSISEGAIVPRYRGAAASVLSRERLDLPSGDFRPRLSKELDKSKGLS